MSRGYIYVLSNEYMPGLVKIGRSEHGGAKRGQQIFQTGVPGPFTLEFEIYCVDAKEAEQRIHDIYTPDRVNSNREFFEMSVSEAILGIAVVASEQYGTYICDEQDYINETKWMAEVAVELGVDDYHWVQAAVIQLAKNNKKLLLDEIERAKRKSRLQVIQ